MQLKSILLFLALLITGTFVQSQILQKKVIEDLAPCEQSAVYLSPYPFIDDLYFVVANINCNTPPHVYPQIRTIVGLLNPNFDTIGRAGTWFENFWFSDYGNPADNSFFVVASNSYTSNFDSLYIGNFNINTPDNNPVMSYTSFRPTNCNYEPADYYSGPNENIVINNFRQGNCGTYKNASVTSWDYNYNIKWEYILGGQKNDELTAIKKLDNGNLLALGHSNTKLPKTNLILLSLDSLGRYIDLYSLPDSINESYSNDLEIDSSGNIYMLWNQNNLLHISKLDKNFNEKWQKSLDTYGLDDVQIQYSKLDHSFVVISNGFNPFTLEFEQLVHKIDVNGEIVWKRIFDERISDFIIKYDGSMLFYADHEATKQTQIIHFDSIWAYYPIDTADTDSSFTPDTDSNSVDPVSVFDGFEENSVKVFPNPFRNKISIDAGGNAIQQISVYNTMGQLIMRSPSIAQKQYTASFDNQVAGVYILEIELENNQKISKRIICDK